MSNFPTDCNNNFQKSKEITRHRVLKRKKPKKGFENRRKSRYREMTEKKMEEENRGKLDSVKAETKRVRWRRGS